VTPTATWSCSRAPTVNRRGPIRASAERGSAEKREQPGRTLCPPGTPRSSPAGAAGVTELDTAFAHAPHARRGAGSKRPKTGPKARPSVTSSRPLRRAWRPGAGGGPRPHRMAGRPPTINRRQ
jgi:hypothetical protein